MRYPDSIEGCLRVAAPLLNRRWWPVPYLPPHYDVMSGGMVWWDEVPLRNGRRPAVVDALRVMWGHRAGLWRGRGADYPEEWELGRRLFPCWVGFHPARVRPKRRWVVLLRANDIACERCLAELDREIDIPPEPGSEPRSGDRR